MLSFTEWVGYVFDHPVTDLRDRVHAIIDRCLEADDDLPEELVRYAAAARQGYVQ